MPDQTTSRGELRFVAVTAIREADGFNPRDRLDPDALAELTASVRARGVLVPLQLAPDPDGGFLVVAGHRRLRAARDAGFTEVPAHVRDAGDERLLDALAENRARQDLTPIQEARAFQRALDELGLRSHKALADRLGERPGLVSERLRLLKLPARAQEHLDAGRIGLPVVPVLLKVAKVSPALADALATAAATDQVDPDRLAREPAAVLARDLPRVELPDDQPAAYATPVGFGGVELDRLLPRDGFEALHERWDALPSDRWGYREPWAMLRFDEDDLDAARAFGCLLELAPDHDGWQPGPSRFLCDAGWVADRVAGKLDLIEAEHARQAEAREAEGRDAQRGRLGADGVDADHADPEQLARVEQDRRREQRDAEHAHRVALRGAHLDLGRALTEAFARPELSMDAARVLAHLAVHRDPGLLAARGLRYLHPALQHDDIKTLASGETRTKITYATAERCQQHLLAWLERAETSEELLGRVLHTLLAAHLADEHVVAKTHRTHYTLPAGRGAHHEPLSALLDRLAAPHLPALLRETPPSTQGVDSGEQPAGDGAPDAGAGEDPGLEQAA